MTTKAESTIPTGTWQSDPVHSSVGFAVRHVVGTFRGSFGEFEATLGDASGEPQLTGRVPVPVRVRAFSMTSPSRLPLNDFHNSSDAPRLWNR